MSKYREFDRVQSINGHWGTVVVNESGWPTVEWDTDLPVSCLWNLIRFNTLVEE